MYKSTPQIEVCLLVISVLALSSNCSQPVLTTERTITVGLVYCDPAELLKAQQVIAQLNIPVEDPTSPKPSRLKLELKSLRLNKNENTISLSLLVCGTLISNSSVYAVIVGRTSCLHKTGDDNSEHILTLSAISFTCAYYQIPVIDLYSRESDFSDKNIYSSFIRMSPPFFHQASIWIELIRKFKFKSVNLIHSVENEGKMLASRFNYLADQHDINILKELEYMPGRDNYSDIIQQVSKSTSKVYLVQSKSNDIEKILKAAGDYELMTPGNVWIVCDGILAERSLAITKNGILVAEYTEEVDLIYHSLAIVKKVFETLITTSSFKKPASNCSENGLEWDIGNKAYEEIVFISHQIGNHKVEFDDDGDRISALYRILNVNKYELQPVGEIRSDLKEMVLQMNVSTIVWPGGLTVKPDGTKWSSKFKIVVIEEKPFIFKKYKPDNVECRQIQNNSVECPWAHGNFTRNYCCFGYCIDLIRLLSERLKFAYEIYIVPDGLYGDLDANYEWNGLMGELVAEKADLILAPFTINPERASYVDFSKPFKYQGITILVKRKSSESSLVSFLQPFKDGLWISVLFSLHVVALVLYLLDRFSPFGKFKMSKTENTEEDALNLSRALWFTWGVLLNSGIGEGTPRSFSARVLGMVWAGFAMIMVASYTANLAAFLVLDRPEAGISGINDARLRNPSENYTYATVKGSAVERYFKRQVELSTMYRKMENKNYETAEEAISDLKNGKIQAFIWDSARLEYEARKSCDFITTGELFGRSSYALALKKGNPWLSKLSMNILSLHENGVMEDLDQEWILLNNTNCPGKDSFPSTLGLNNMAGVFMLVAGGVIVGIFLIFVEIAYKKRKDKKLKEHDLSRKAFANWRKNIEKRKMRSARNSFDFSAAGGGSLLSGRSGAVGVSKNLTANVKLENLRRKQMETCSSDLLAINTETHPLNIRPPVISTTAPATSNKLNLPLKPSDNAKGVETVPTTSSGYLRPISKTVTKTTLVSDN